MLELLAAIELSCTNINKIVSRMVLVENMTDQEKIEVVYELQKTNPNCKIEVVIK